MVHSLSTYKPAATPLPTNKQTKELVYTDGVSGLCAYYPTNNSIRPFSNVNGDCPSNKEVMYKYFCLVETVMPTNLPHTHS